MDLEDEDLKSELKRIDPKDYLGIFSILSTAFNIIYSAIYHYYTFDTLISVSLIFGILSVMHKNGIIAKISLAALFAHLSIIGLLRWYGI